MKRLLPVLTGALLALSAAVMLLAALLHFAGTNAPLMHRMLTRYAPVASTGLPEAEYGPMAEMITTYLAGEREEFQHTFSVAGDLRYLCFGAREQQHMQDCLGLFTLCRQVLTVSTAAFLALTAALWAQRKRLQTILLVAGRTLLTLMCAILALAAWGVIDFSSLFILFHRISFTNDLWMLDPATDLLIRLMPTNFFIAYAGMVGGAWLLLCIALCAAMLMIRRRVSTAAKRGVK